MYYANRKLKCLITTVNSRTVSGIFIFICLLFLGKEQSKRSNILYADKLFHSFIDILQIAQRKEIVLWF